MEWSTLKKLIYSRGRIGGSTPPTPPATAYVKLSAPSSFSLSTTKKWNGTMEYSTDGENWSAWDGSSISGKEIYLRGIGNTTVTNGQGAGAFSITGSSVSVEGNIETLLDYETVIAGSHPTMNTDCFRSLFYNNQTSLTDASRLLLPAVTLSEGCYRSLFFSCKSLVAAPELPATSLAPDCYRTMFYDCAALTSAPELPATSLATSCYNSMFQGCGLTTPPALPATTLATSCYQGMFRNCAALTSAPALPVTTLVDSCYYDMFNGCAALTTPPALPATTLAASCYAWMFANCAALTSAPALPATTLVDSCYMSMFYETKLKISNSTSTGFDYSFRVPTSGTGTKPTNATQGMFSGKQSSQITNPSVNTTYYANFPSISA